MFVMLRAVACQTPRLRCSGAVDPVLEGGFTDRPGPVWNKHCREYSCGGAVAKMDARRRTVRMTAEPVVENRPDVGKARKSIRLPDGQPWKGDII
jgi:hypothetical protein